MRTIAGCFFGLALAAFGASEITTTWTVTAEAPLTIGGTAGADQEHNQVNNLIDLQSGATLTVQNPPNSGKAIYFWSTLVVTNGPATIVLGDVATSLDLCRSVIVRAPGSLTVKSAKCRAINVGHNFSAGTVVSYDLSQFDFSGGVTFADLDDVDVTASTTVSFYADRLTFVSTCPAFPTGSFVAGGIYSFGSPNMFADVGDTVAFDASNNRNYNIRLLATNVFTSSQTVSLAQYRKIYLTPADVPDVASTLNRAWAYKDGDYDFDVRFAHKETAIVADSVSNVTFRGSVSGAGSIQATRHVKATAGNFIVTRFLGDLSEFTGNVNASEDTEVVLNAEHLTRAIVQRKGTVSILSPAEGGPAAATIDGVDGTQNVTLYGIVRVAAGQRLTVGTVTGTVLFAGDKEAEDDSIDILSAAPGAKIFTDDSVSITFNGETVPAAYVTRPQSSATSLRVWLIPDENGVVTIPPNLTKPAASSPWYEVAGGVKVAGVPEGYGLRAVEGSTVPPVAPAGAEDAAFVGAFANEAVRLESHASGWQSVALYWFDPSDAETVFWAYQVDGKSPNFKVPLTPQTATASPDRGNLVTGIADKRGPAKSTMRLWNGRQFNHYTDKPESYIEDVGAVFPILSSAVSSNELSYLAFGNYGTSRRLQFADFTEGVTITNALSHYVAVTPRFVVMVYGSQKGGGGAILANSSKSFKRASTTVDAPMLPFKADVWVNGTQVDPTVTGFSGEWDVISMAIPATVNVGALGSSAGNYQSENGGMYYGEMVFFAEVPDTTMRREVEMYLAKKWGLAAKYNPVERPVARARLAGTGMVQVTSDDPAELSGVFCGTLDLAENVAVKLANGVVPYTAAEILALKPAFWVDPDDADTLIYDTSAPNRVFRIFQQDPARRMIGTDPYLTSLGGGRAPIATQKAAAFGVNRTWVDYNGTNEVSASNNGNTMRIYTADATLTDAKYLTPVNTRMGFIVQNSRRGGGTPFLDTVGASSLVKKRIPKGAYTKAIYESETSALLRNGNTYLNGTAIDYTKGFTGGAEVFTFTATAEFPVAVFAYYENSQGDNTYKYGEEQGEILLFGSELDDTTRGRVEGYLMKKWFGYGPASCVDYSAAMLTGAGSFTCTSLSVAPQLAEGFTGTLGITESADFKMALVPDGETIAVMGAVVAPGATLALPATATVTVDSADGKVPAGTYTLINVADVGVTEFMLAGAVLARNPGAVLLQNGGTVSLKVPVSGGVIIFR